MDKVYLLMFLFVSYIAVVAFTHYRKGNISFSVAQIVLLLVVLALTAPGLQRYRTLKAWRGLVDSYFGQRGMEYRFVAHYGGPGWNSILYVGVGPGGAEHHVFLTFSEEFDYGDVEALANVIAEALSHLSVRGEATVVLCLPEMLSQHDIEEILRYLDEMLHVENVNIITVLWRGGIVSVG